MNEAKKFLSLLAGTWHLERQIMVKGHPESRFRGLAHIRPSDVRGRFSYSEEGHFIGERVIASGIHDYIYKIDGARLEILFADARRPGEPFITLDFKDDLIAQDTYLNGDDIYALHYEIINADHYHVDMTISGPEKDIRMVTQYRRL